MLDFVPNPACLCHKSQWGGYRYRYHEILYKIYVEKSLPEKPWISRLILDDLFFIVCFILEIPNCNNPFVVEMCKMVERGPDGWCLDLWARYHWKTTIKTKARTIQRIVKYPNRCTMIASHTRPIAKKMMRPIMQVLENNELLKRCFPEVLYQNPRNESPKWSEDDGIVVRRQNAARSEATVEAWGIKEGMPISVHFDWILLDDLETKDDVRNPDVINHAREAFDLCNFLITPDGSIDVTGTPYSHEGIYIPFIKNKVDSEDKPRYTYRPIPATKDGTKDGEPVMMSRKDLADVYSDMTKEEGSLGEYIFNCQMLINPTPVGVRKLSGDLIKDIDPKDIPKNIFKFLPIDPAGDDKNGKGDAWAFGVIGMEPKMDDLGANNIYVCDLEITPLREEEAPLEIARMYRRNGMIMQVGVEKVGLSTAEIHVANALAKYGIYISVEKQTLVILRPGGMDNRARIEKALPWPLFNGKIFMSTDIPQIYRDRLRMEMDKFPFWHDDGLTMLAYFYTMVKSFHFGWWGTEEEDEEDQRDRRVVPLRRNAVTGY